MVREYSIRVPADKQTGPERIGACFIDNRKRLPAPATAAASGAPGCKPGLLTLRAEETPVFVLFEHALARNRGAEPVQELFPSLIIT
jgi:hypothetical protein